MQRRKRLIALSITFTLILIGATPFGIQWLLYRVCQHRLAGLRRDLHAVGPLPDSLASARLSLETLVRFHEAQLPQYYRSWRTLLFRTARRFLSVARSDLDALRRGEDPYRSRRGVFLQAYRSEIDGGVEPYFLDVPRTYDPARRWPLVVQLHGLVALGAPFQMVIPEHREDCITLASHAKGSIDFKWVSEQEVLQAIREVTERYAIDPARIYIQGHSMGATGAWSLASHYPDLFAALAATAGNTDHRVWEELWEAPEVPDGSHLTGLRQFIEDADSAVSYAANLSHTPVYCAHGTSDDIVPAAHSRRMVDRLRAEGGAVEYHEIPLVPHTSLLLPSASSQIDWLLTRPRSSAAQHIRLRCSRLRYARSHWIEILRFERLLQFAQVEAEIVDGRQLAIRTDNVSRLAIHRQPELPPSQEIELSINGHPVPVRPEDWQNDSLALVREGETWTGTRDAPPLRKRRGLEGPIEDAMMSRFLVVYGTGPTDATEARVLRREAEALREQWQMRFGYPCPLKADTDVTPQDIEEGNLICYGRPDQNRIVGRCRNDLPFRLEENSVALGHQSWEGPDVGVKFGVPNPLNPNRYLVVFASSSWRSMFQMNNRFGNWFDWSAYENRNYFDYAVFDDRTDDSPETFLAFGYFGQEWGRDPDCEFRGNEALRQHVRPWRTPVLTKPHPGTSAVSLSCLIPERVSQLLGPAQWDAGYAGGPLAVGERTFSTGFGVKAPSSIEFRIDGRFRKFSAWVGVDSAGQTVTERHRENNWLVFDVEGDGRRLLSSGKMGCGDRPRLLECSVAGVERLRLSVRQVDGRRWFLLGAAWGEPALAR